MPFINPKYIYFNIFCIILYIIINPFKHHPIYDHDKVEIDDTELLVSELLLFVSNFFRFSFYNIIFDNFIILNVTYFLIDTLDIFNIRRIGNKFLETLFIFLLLTFIIVLSFNISYGIFYCSYVSVAPSIRNKISF